MSSNDEPALRRLRIDQIFEGVDDARNAGQGELTFILRCLVLALSFLIVFSGCSTYSHPSYSGRPVPVPKIETMPIWRTEGLVTVGVDPYIQLDRQKEVFDDDLEKAKILPIYLLVRNSGERPLSLRHADIKLEFPNGLQSLLDDSETVLQWTGRDPTKSAKLQAAGAARLFFLFPLIPLFIAQKKAIDARIADYASRVADYKEKDFKDVKLGKDESAHGFVYYTYTYGIPTKGKLVLRFVDETDGSDFVIRVPVSEQ